MLEVALVTGVVEGMDAPEGRFAAGSPDGVYGGLRVLVDGRGVGELDAVVGQHSVDAIGHGIHQSVREVGRSAACSLLMQLGEGDLACPIDGHEQVQLAGFGVDLGGVEVEVVDRVALKRVLAAWAPSGAGSREMP